MYIYSDKFVKYKNLFIKGIVGLYNILWLIFILNFFLFYYYIININDKVYKYFFKL